MKQAIDLLKAGTIEDLERVWAQFEGYSGKYKLPLVRSPFGFEEIMEALDSLLTTMVTMGSKVMQFEKDFAKYIGVKHAIMVNSGSSANLLALHILSNPVTENHIQPGDEILVPSLTWSTSIFPILDIGAVPVLVDSDKDTFNLDVDKLYSAITDKTKAILAVHLLGNPCDLSKLKDFAEEHGLFLIEDSCEAHGAEYNTRKVGSYGDLGTFSFFFSHHISTIEGGMITTDNSDFANLACSLRAHGWIRERSDRSEIIQQYPQIDNRFLFVNRGFNLRPTEIQGAFGIHQLKKLDGFVQKRRQVANYWTRELETLNEFLHLQKEQTGGLHSWFGFPVVIENCDYKKRQKMVDYLEKKGIETRVIMGGNMAVQPAMSLFPHKIGNDLSTATYISESGIFIGLHANISLDERDLVVKSLHEGVRAIG